MTSARMFGPKSADHWSVGEPCPACRQPLAPGDYTTLIALGPGADPTARAKAAAGEVYNAVATELHWTCATGQAAKA